MIFKFCGKGQLIYFLNMVWLPNLNGMFMNHDQFSWLSWFCIYVVDMYVWCFSKCYKYCLWFVLRGWHVCHYSRWLIIIGALNGSSKNIFVELLIRWVEIRVIWIFILISLYFWIVHFYVWVWPQLLQKLRLTRHKFNY